MQWRPWSDLRALVDLAAPGVCAGCDRPGERWCAECAGVLHGIPARAWRPTPCPDGMPPCWSGPSYDGPVRAAVVAWKEADRVDLTGPLAQVLGASVAAALRESEPHAAALAGRRPVVVVPAPSSRSSTRARGRAPVTELAVRAVGDGVVVDALRLGRPVRDQAGLSAAQRAQNLSGAVRARPAVRALVHGRPCVVVDDVVTTGATLVECARALLAAGSGPVVAATVAATARRS